MFGLRAQSAWLARLLRPKQNCCFTCCSLPCKALESNTTVRLLDLSGCQVGRLDWFPIWACGCDYARSNAADGMSGWQRSVASATPAVSATTKCQLSKDPVHVCCWLPCKCPPVLCVQVSAGTCVVLAETLSVNTGLDAIILQVSFSRTGPTS